MRITFDTNGKIKVEGEAAIRNCLELDKKTIKADNEAQEWFITTPDGNLLTLPAVCEPFDEDGNFKLLKDLRISEEERAMLVDQCPIASGMFCFRTRPSRTIVYDFVQAKWICVYRSSGIGILIVFRAIYLRLLEKLDAFDRECRNTKYLKRIADALERNDGAIATEGFVNVVVPKQK